MYSFFRLTNRNRNKYGNDETGKRAKGRYCDCRTQKYGVFVQNLFDRVFHLFVLSFVVFVFFSLEKMPIV